MPLNSENKPWLLHIILAHQSPNNKFEPRIEVYCFRLNFNMSKLVSSQQIVYELHIFTAQ